MAQQLFDTHHEKLNDFDEWIKTQKRLPQNIGKTTTIHDNKWNRK